MNYTEHLFGVGAIEKSPISKKEIMDDTEQSQNLDVAAQTVETHDHKTPKESFAELRKSKDDLERQLWQANKERDLLQQHYSNQTMSHKQIEEEEDFDFRQLEQEEFPDGKKLLKAFGTINKKMSAYEKKLAEKDQKIQVLEAASEFADFKDIVTAENIEKYIKSDDDNLEAVQKAVNPLRKVYNLIKKDVRYQQDKIAITQKSRPISQEQQRVDEKEGKVKTGSIGVRSEAITAFAATSNSRMSKQQREALWSQTQAAARK